MKRFIDYLNPLSHLGLRDYSIKFPFAVSVLVIFVSEYLVYRVLENPMAVGIYIIFVHVALIVYFSFRSGIFGGLTAAYIAILYYIYIIYDRNYTGAQFNSGIRATIVYGLLYSGVALIIGYLKQKIDNLIEQEADEKIRLQTIIDQLPVGVVITDANGKIVQGNKQLKRILGREIRKEVTVGKDTLVNARDLNDKRITPNQWPLAQTLASGKTITKKEFIIKKDEGKDIYVQISSSLIKNKKGKAVAAASIIADITNEKEMEKRKDDFVNMASHELKTPITSIRLYTDSLFTRIKGKVDSNVEKTLKSIKYQTDKLHELVSDLLDISRIQSGKLNFNKENTDLVSLVEETIVELQKTTKTHKIIVNNKNDKLIIFADKFRIYQVLTNLITNAIKYSPDADKININIKKSGNKAEVAIQDYGIGISKNQFKKIFERLYQVSDHKEKTFPGLGMGLYISKEIIGRHKGNIWVKSTKGKGSTFYFTLPLAKRPLKTGKGK